MLDDPTGATSGGQAGGASTIVDVTDSEQEPEQKLEGKTNQLSKASKLIIPAFLVIALVALLALILGLTGATNFSGFFWVILLANFFGALIGATGVYLWGTISEWIDKMKDQNSKFSYATNACLVYKHIMMFVCAGNQLTC